ncbi:MAG: 50S ribosomal protein L25/general stress protein Ctc [Deltaproteobacteria bacterium]|nr:50S ribosomal protein L25/general stress protein Ctc [Candidatus Zymogenaceae bacterium]
MEIGELNVQMRETVGKGPARKLREEGLVPGVVYGQNVEATKIIIDPADIKKGIRTQGGANPLFTIVAEGEGAKNINGKTVVVREIQLNPINYGYLHVDLVSIDVKQEITVEVSLNYTGKAEGVKAGGILQEIRRVVELTSLPVNIPRSIDVDVTAMKIGDSLHLEDITLPEGCRVDTDINFTLATIAAPRGLEEAVEEGAAEELVEGEEAPAETAEEPETPEVEE